MLLPDFFERLPPAAALLVLCSIFQAADAEALPRPTQTIELRQLNVSPWPPVETLAPRYPPVLAALRVRQENTVCGYLGGDPDLPATCSAGSHCAAELDHKAIGCCPNEGPCSQGVFTSCVDKPQLVLDPYVYTCTGNNVCYMNEFDDGYYQWGCGASSGLATKVAASAPGKSALNIVSLSVALTAEPSTLSGSTTTSSATTSSSSATETESSETSSTESSATNTESKSSKTDPTTTTEPAASSTAPTSDEAPASEGESKNTGAIIGGTIGGVAAAVIIIALIALFLRRRRGNVREGPGSNQGSEFIKSPIDGYNGHTFAPLPPPQQEVAQVEPPRGVPAAYAHPGNRVHEYDNLVTSPYAQRDSDDFSQRSSDGGAAGVGSPGARLENDQIPLTRDARNFQPPTSEPPVQAPQVHVTPPATEPNAPLIREPDDMSYQPPQTSYVPRGDGGSALWHQNRQTSRNPTWM